MSVEINSFEILEKRIDVKANIVDAIVRAQCTLDLGSEEIPVEKVEHVRLCLRAGEARKITKRRMRKRAWSQIVSYFNGDASETPNIFQDLEDDPKPAKIEARVNLNGRRPPLPTDQDPAMEAEVFALFDDLGEDPFRPAA